ncbi:hypothetical protein HMPREF0988_02757, partial [Lachnospiraceae bacterium 1_4_56FAA]
GCALIYLKAKSATSYLMIGNYHSQHPDLVERIKEI